MFELSMFLFGVFTATPVMPAARSVASMWEFARPDSTFLASISQTSGIHHLIVLTIFFELLPMFWAELCKCIYFLNCLFMLISNFFIKG
jgi:hypothetical protein